LESQSFSNCSKRCHKSHLMLQLQFSALLSNLAGTNTAMDMISAGHESTIVKCYRVLKRSPFRAQRYPAFPTGCHC
ncbi:hypothetical protein, partial [Burkholderia cenocepacia]|uniref:hypothetical protein n=1 Tax=Burkholderia cenocepacia TaxID=95486 RepID=UPI001B90432E